MSASDPSKRLASLLRKLKADASGAEPSQPPLAWADPAVDQLIYSTLLADCSSSQARGAYKRLREAMVDYNELRVCLPDELAAVIGDRLPRSLEKATRLRAALTDLYKREHVVTFGTLNDAGKREARAYVESLEGVSAFAAARVILYAFGGHAVPVDDRLRSLLASEGVCDADTPASEVASWLERHIRSGEAAETCQLLQAWSDSEGAAEPKAKSRAAKADEPAPKARAAAGATAKAKAPRKKAGKAAD